MRRGGAPVSLAATSCCAVLAYAAATPDPTEPFLAMVLGAIGIALSWRFPKSLLPGWAAGLLAAVVLLRTADSALSDGLGVSDFASLVLWLLVIKLFDRRTGVDAAQALALSVFLCVASMLLNNGVTVALISFLYLPCLAYSAMRVQLDLQAARATRLAGRGAGEPVSVRAAASPGARTALLRTSFYAVSGGMLVAVVVFVIVPRGAGLANLGRWGTPGVGRVVGFNDRMHVGMGGVVSQSDAAVMHLRLTDSNGQSVGGMGAVQYLRGAVLDTYSDGVWESSAPPHRGLVRSERLPGQSESFMGPGQAGVLHQDYTILNTAPDHAYLFTIWRPNEITYHDRGTIAINKQHMTAMNLGSGGKFRYSVRSSPYEPDSSRRTARPRVIFESPVVRRVAERILAEHGIEADPRRRPVARDGAALSAFRDYFWSNYTYKLGTPPAPAGQDPIEWFLTQGTEGHCEYYASAMTALCRSVGIPARVVTGYIAVEFDVSTSHYIVRESNAHAWVEAQQSPGVWKQLEPTPPTSLLEVHTPEGGLLARAGRALDVLNYRWVNSVVAFDSGGRSSLLGWSDPATQSVHEQISRAMDFTRLTPSGVLIRVAVHILITVVGGFLSGYLVIMLLRRWRLARANRPRAMADRIEADDIAARVREFPVYQRLMRATARAGLHKPAWQPLRSWAMACPPSVRPDLLALAELFYVIRFGGRELTEAERDRAEALLSAIERSLATDKRPA